MERGASGNRSINTRNPSCMYGAFLFANLQERA
jgi:hypothetical protein